MKVYRICLAKWSKSLTASGIDGRWNSKGKFVIYTSGSRALASLENIVHRSGEGLNKLFNVMVIHVPDTLKITEIKYKDLPSKWYYYQYKSTCQMIGNQWIDLQKTPVLKVPSSIIQEEHNYLLNPNHPDFRKIRLEKVEPFKFDPRIKR